VLTRSAGGRISAGRSTFAFLSVLATLALGVTDRAYAQAALPASVADVSARELLNSERIERTFGSYGIEVLESDATIRVSNLYSLEHGERVCRTFAVVRYPAVVDPEFAAEHAAIVAGQSIGATFAAGGWTVVKTHRYFGEVDTTPRLAALMGGVTESRLAMHVYELDIVKDGARYQYAAIAEVHHPDYLDLAEVRGIYGAGVAPPAEPDAAVRRLLELVEAAAHRE
jgi:hypothetical protein